AAAAFVERLHHLLGVGEGAAEVLGRDLLDHTAMLVENAEHIARDWAAPLIPELTARDEDAVVGERGAEAVRVARFLPAELAVVRAIEEPSHQRYRLLLQHPGTSPSARLHQGCKKGASSLAPAGRRPPAARRPRIRGDVRISTTQALPVSLLAGHRDRRPHPPQRIS